MGNSLVTMILLGWIPVTILTFAVFSPRRAFFLTTLGGWMFLPVHSVPIPGFVDFDKTAAVSFSALLGVLLFDSDRLKRASFHRFDIPMTIWCASPMVTSYMNDLGLYDGLSGVLDRGTAYYLPYLLGRIYLGTYAGLRELAIAFVICGLVYAPFSLWEVRMSPQLHTQIYGYFAHSGGFAQVFRFGGWRPMVFMHHGLMLGLFMAMSALCAFGLWFTQAKLTLLRVPMFAVFLFLVAVNILGKSTGSIALLAIGIGAMVSMRMTRQSIAYWVIALIPLTYVSLRAPGIWDGQNLVEVVSEYLGPERAHSLDYRFEAEGLLSAKAMEQPIYGWGEHDRGRVDWEKSDDGKVVPDGLWIQAFNVNGLIGIGGLLLTFLFPIYLVGRKVTPAEHVHGHPGLISLLSLVVGLYMLDNLLNAMVVPVYFSILGGLVGYAIANPGIYRKRARPPVVHPTQVRWYRAQRANWPKKSHSRTA